MSDRSRDWFAQAEHDLGLARVALEGARYDWACFAAHQAAEKAVKALHLHHRQEAWGHVIARLLRGLRDSPSDDLLDCARVLAPLPFRPGTPIRFPRGHRANSTDAVRGRRRSLVPTRSSVSSVTRWPDADVVLAAAEAWAHALAAADPRVLRVGMFGSFCSCTTSRGGLR